MASTTVKDYILYYKNKLDRFKDNEDMILETLHKLAKPPTVTAEIVQDTGILRYLHKLCKRKGPVADTALPLFNKWKLLLTIAMQQKDNLKRASPEKANHSSTSVTVKFREGDPSARSSHPALDKDPSNHPPHRSRDPHPDRGIKRKDPFPPSADPKRPTHHSHRETHPKHPPPQKDHHPPPDSKPTTNLPPDTKHANNPPHHHRSSDSDSDRGSRHQTVKKEYMADGHPRKDYLLDSAHGNPRNPKRDSEEISHRGVGNSKKDLEAPPRDFKPRKDLSVAMETDGGLSHHSRDGGSRSFQRDVVPMEVDEAGGSNRDSDSRHPPAKKDYFSAEADTTCPGSRSSEHNGVSNSQDSNHHIDIDSLSNPNLCIEISQAEKMNTSDDSEPVTPTKRAKTLEPYYIEMREGMFRAVKNHASPFSGSGLKVCEQIHRDIIKGNTTYKRDREKYDDHKSNLHFSLSPPREASGDGEKLKNGPAEQAKPSGTEKTGRASSGSNSKHDLKRKSDSPCKGSEKKMMRPDSTSDHKLKVKKEVLSPSHLPKTLNNVEGHQSNCDRNKKLLDSPEASAMQYISSKKDRRAVYSGRKSAQDISSLKSSCLRVLRKNLDYLRFPMKVPYETLHPILETLNPSQLSKIEEHNRHLLAYTNSLWKQHYNRDYRSQVVLKNEKDVMWKEEYNRAQEQKNKKLKYLTASINASASKAKPDRQAKVVDSHHDFGRRGTRTPEVPIPSSRIAAPSVSPTPKASSSGPRTVLPIISKPKEIKHSSAHKPVKKVVAPLMSKVKKSMAIVYRQK